MVGQQQFLLWQSPNETSCQSGIGPLLIALLVLHFAILFWIISVITIVPLRFAQLRDVWKLDGLFGVSVFEGCFLITVLLAVLILVDAFAMWLQSVRFGWFRVIGYLSSAVVVAALGRDLYSFVSIPLNDSWYYQALKDEPIDPERFHLGRIIDTSMDGCRDSALSCIRVVLDSGETLAVNLSPNIWGELSEIVVVEESVGRFSGNVVFEATSYVSYDDAEMFWRNYTR